MSRLAILLAFSILSPAPEFAQTAKRQIAVAAAANLSQVIRAVGADFERDTGIHPVFSFGSTAALTRQIENGAPWDVFAAADTEHVDELDRKGFLTKGSRAVYATGILALWLTSPDGSVRRLQDLADPSLHVIALAKPELAPYGLAARQTLDRLGIRHKVESKLVYAENVSMAKQYGVTGDADAVFTALALMKHDDGGLVIRIPEEFHQPIRQALGIVAASKNQALARQFADYLLTGRGHEVLLKSGYR
jgi:molybdate transport system substrate-binding protein